MMVGELVEGNVFVEVAFALGYNTIRGSKSVASSVVSVEHISQDSSKLCRIVVSMDSISLVLHSTSLRDTESRNMA